MKSVMAASTSAVLCFFLFLLPLSVNAAIFEIVNNCSFTVWPAWVFTTPRTGGGKQLDPDQSWRIEVNASTTSGRIWARTNCSFGVSCQTGDCGEVLQCQDYGQPPNTFAEFSLNQFNNLDFFDISLVDGYNVGLDISPTTGGCRGIRCSANVVGECPAPLRTPGGCKNSCTVFGTPQYCCTSGSCGPTNYSIFFKTRCPDAYSYPQDDATSTFTCPGGTNYRVTFCPPHTPQELVPIIRHDNITLIVSIRLRQ